MIALRLDANHTRGMGHLFRMRTLAEVLGGMGVQAVVVLRENSVAQSLVAQWGLTAVKVPTDAREIDIPALACAAHPQLAVWAFDVLETQADWVLAAKRQGLRVVVFDDAGPGASHADLRINPIIGCWQGRPEPLPEGTLEGPAYAVLPARLASLRHARQQTGAAGSPRRVGVTLGGSDTHGATLQVAACAAQWTARRTDLHCTVFTGPHFQHDAELAALLAAHAGRVRWRQNVPDLLAELSALDAVICSGGQTLFEAAALGLPMLAVANEPHERQTIDYFAARNALWSAGEARKPDAEAIEDFFQAIIRQDPNLHALGNVAAQLVDCQGAQRCAAACVKLLHGEYRHVQACDGECIPKEL